MRNIINSRFILLWLLLILARTTSAQIMKLDSVTIEGCYKCLYEYDDQLNCTLKTGYRFYSNELHVSFIVEYTYDNLSRMTSMITRDNGVNKTEYFYNEQGLLSEEVLSYYNGTNWHFTNKYINEYDEDGNKTLFVKYENKENVWIEKEKILFDYESSRLLSEIRYICGGLYDKKNYSYNDEGLCNEISTCYYKYVLPEPEEWIEYGKELFEYDDTGNLIAKIVLQKGIDSNELFFWEKTELAYDEDNNCIHIDFYHNYDYNLGQWSSLVDSFDYTYDAAISDSNIAVFPSVCKDILESFDLCVPLHNKLQIIIKNDYLGDISQCNFYYSQLNTLDEPVEVNLSVWPNPAKETVYVEGVEFSKVQIYNALGQLIIETKDNMIDLSNQNAGTYIIKVITPSGIHTKQIIKN